MIDGGDPTLRTIEALNRELANLKELLFGRLDALAAAATVRQNTLDAIPANTRVQIASYGDVQDEKFRTVSLQFAERDVRTEQAGKASTEALAAALQAAKELVGAQGEASAAAAVKSETSFTKQIDQIATIISTLEKALDGRITELKERIDRGEGTAMGARENRVVERDARIDERATTGTNWTIVGGVGGMFALALIIIDRLITA